MMEHEVSSTSLSTICVHIGHAAVLEAETAILHITQVLGIVAEDL